MWILGPLLKDLGMGADKDNREKSTAKDIEEMKAHMKAMDENMKKLLTGFADGTFADTIGKAAGKHGKNKIKAEIKPSILGG